MLLLVSLSLLLSLVEVHSQIDHEYPYVSFMGETLPNHAYVDISLVEIYSWNSNTSWINRSLHCVTDVVVCCSSDNVSYYRGDWYLPNEDQVELLSINDVHSSGEDNIVAIHQNGTVSLTFLNDTSSSGIYHCEIPVYDEYDEVIIKTVYVGLYQLSEG